MALYIIISTEDKLNVVITPNLITVMDIIMNSFQQATSGIPIVLSNMKKLNLQNDIGHESRIVLFVPKEVNTFIYIIFKQDNFYEHFFFIIGE